MYEGWLMRGKRVYDGVEREWPRQRRVMEMSIVLGTFWANSSLYFKPGINFRRRAKIFIGLAFSRYIITQLNYQNKAIIYNNESLIISVRYTTKYSCYPFL
jgi:hypothetical protein